MNAMDPLTHLFGGWTRLQRLHPDRPMKVDRTFAESSLYFGRSLMGSYRRCVDVSVGPHGLRIAIRWLSSRYFLPPIVVAWPDILRCDPAKMGFVGEAVKLSIRGWPNPLYVGRFLWKYGDVCREIRDRWDANRYQTAS